MAAPPPVSRDSRRCRRAPDPRRPARSPPFASGASAPEILVENFINAQNFVNKVGIIAETEGHHPDIWFGWGYAKIKIFTHAINGLAESDFILAAKIDKIN